MFGSAARKGLKRLYGTTVPGNREFPRMPNGLPRVPPYCHHKAKGLAYVKLGSTFVYFGRFHSPESKVEY